MKGRRHSPREKDLTARLLAGDAEMDRIERKQRFSQRSSGAQHAKMQRTALLRAAEEEFSQDLDALPVGQVVQIHSLFSQVEADGVVWLCVVRKTLAKLSETPAIVGDLVRFRSTGQTDEQGRPEAVIEYVFPRKTVLARADSFKAMDQHPIVANADQLLLVASLVEPRIKWGLIDRMLVAAEAGGLRPTLCINKWDLVEQAGKDFEFAQAALEHYSSLGVGTLRTSTLAATGLEELRTLLADHMTVLAGHSGVGKSSLIGAIEPTLKIRIGAISNYTGKGRHVTTSARRYGLGIGGHVVDTPGVKLFGLWGLSDENLINYFPDVEAGTAPPWRQESFERILQSLRERS